MIQPFDERFDKRFDDIFKPAINAASLEPYRVDKDPAVLVPIETIEAAIREARICFADITMDNPNVWYELGYAIAAGKEVVLVCAKDRGNPYPFDVRHRAIIQYSSEAPRDFRELEDKITDKLKAILAKQAAIDRVAAHPPELSNAELSYEEVVTLVAVAENMAGPGDSVLAEVIQRDLERAGFRPLDIILGLISLGDKGFLEYSAYEENGGNLKAYTMTPKGQRWLIANKDRLPLRSKKDDIPF